MPFGSISVFASIIADLEGSKPERVLDLGSGNGINAAGIRNWVNRDAFIVSVDAHPPTKGRFIFSEDYHVRNTIEAFFQGDAALFNRFDVILMTDVIEHMEQATGFLVLESIKEHLAPGGRAYVSTPAIWMEQGPVDGNEYETHRSLWTVDDFIQAGFRILKDGQPDVFGHQMILAKFIKEA